MMSDRAGSFDIKLSIFKEFRYLVGQINFMKRILIVLLTAASLTSFAQKASDKAVKQSCDCMSKINMKQEYSAIDKAFEGCLINAVMANLGGLTKEYKFDITDEAASEKVGEKIGLKLVEQCPAFLEYAALAASQDDEEEEDADKKPEYEFSEGVVADVRDGELLAITLEENSGDRRVFYVTESFYGGEDLLKDIAHLKSKKLKLGWVNKNLYDSASKSFKERKVVYYFEYL
jgi:hypothetical protein